MNRQKLRILLEAAVITICFLMIVEQQPKAGTFTLQASMSSFHRSLNSGATLWVRQLLPLLVKTVSPIDSGTTDTDIAQQ